MRLFKLMSACGFIMLTAFHANAQSEHGYHEEYEKDNPNSFSVSGTKAISEYYLLKNRVSGDKAKLSENSDDKSNWEFFGPDAIPLNPNSGAGTNGSSGTGRVLSFVKNEVTDQWYLGTGNGGLWTRVSGGDWQPLTNDYRLRGGVDNLIIDDQGSIWCLSIVDNISYGVLKSEDNGATWGQMNNGIMSAEFSDKTWDKPWSLTFDPNDQDIMYYTSQSKIYKSVNRGVQWTQLINNGVPDNDGNGNPDWVYYKDLAINPANSNELIVTGNMLFHSIDAGNTWVDITMDITDSTDVWEVSVESHPSYPNKFWFYYFSEGGHYNRDGQVFVQLDVALHDTIYHAPTTTHQNYATKLVVSPNDRVYFSDNFIRAYDISTDAITNSLNTESTYLPAPSTWVHIDIRGMTVYDNNGVDEVYLCNDGGLNYSEIDNLSSIILWDHLTNDFGGVYSFDVGRIGVSQSNPEVVVAGFWDMRSTFKNDNGWFLVNKGLADGTGGLVHPNDPTQGILHDVYGNIQMINTITGESKDNFADDGTSLRRPAMVLHPDDPEILLVGGDAGSLRKYTLDWINQDATYVVAHSSSKIVSCVAVAPSNTDVWYLGYRDLSTTLANVFYRSLDGGSTWGSIGTNGLDGYLTGYASDIEVNPNNENELWVAFEMANGSDRVYHSTDAGENWEALVNGYPSGVPATSLAYDAILGDLYVGTFCGVLRYSTESNSWINFDQCLPAVKVSDIQIQKSGRFLYAGTYGRGIWRTNLNFCPDDQAIQITSPITVDTEYEARQSIEANSEIVSTADVFMRTSRDGFIELQTGFEAEATAAGGSVVVLEQHKSSCMTCSSTELYKMSHVPSEESHLANLTYDENVVEGIEIAPNPTEDVALITLTDASFDVVKYEVVDLTGRARIHAVNSEGGDQFELHVKGLEVGMYILKCHGAKGDERAVRFLKK